MSVLWGGSFALLEKGRIIFCRGSFSAKLPTFLSIFKFLVFMCVFLLQFWDFEYSSCAAHIGKLGYISWNCCLESHLFPVNLILICKRLIFLPTVKFIGKSSESGQKGLSGLVRTLLLTQETIHLHTCTYLPNHHLTSKRLIQTNNWISHWQLHLLVWSSNNITTSSSLNWWHHWIFPQKRNYNEWTNKMCKFFSKVSLSGSCNILSLARFALFFFFF